MSSTATALKKQSRRRTQYAKQLFFAIVGQLLTITSYCRVIATSSGYFLTKADLFRPGAARGAGQVIINVFLPALLFSKIVPGFTAENLVALGPLILVACIYHLYGFVIGWVTRKLFWVPRRFQSGILAAGIWGNWGDMPTAVIMSMTASAPFKNGDPDRAVAYISAFMLVMSVTLFPLGGYRLMERDFADGEMPADTDDEVSESEMPPLSRQWYRLRSAIQHRRETGMHTDVEQSEGSQKQYHKADQVYQEDPNPLPQAILSRHVSFNPSDCGRLTCTPTLAYASPAPTVVDGIITMSQAQDDLPKPSPPEFKPTPTPSTPQSSLKRALAAIRSFLISLASPITITIIVSFVVAVVPPLKALFIAPPVGSNVRIGSAPDGLPPLNIILDTTSFIGGASIPFSLVCLGSALAGLHVPKPISRAPLGAITAFSIFKMVIGPVFGVLVTEALTHHTSLIDPNDKVLRFVCMYFSGVPTSTSQVYLTQIYSPDGLAQHVSAFLIPQYALMFLTMTALSAYVLNILF